MRLMNTDQVSSAEDKLMSMVQGVEFLDSMFEIVKNAQLECNQCLIFKPG